MKNKNTLHPTSRYHLLTEKNILKNTLIFELLLIALGTSLRRINIFSVNTIEWGNIVSYSGCRKNNSIEKNSNVRIPINSWPSWWVLTMKKEWINKYQLQSTCRRASADTVVHLYESFRKFMSVLSVPTWSCNPLNKPGCWSGGRAFLYLSELNALALTYGCNTGFFSIVTQNPHNCY